MDNIIVNSALWYAEQSSQFLLNSGANKLLDKGYDYYVKEFIPLGHRLIQNGQIAADAMDGELAAQFSMAYVANYWRSAKTVYNFAPEFLRTLAETEDAPIYSDIMMRLPYRDFVMNLPAGSHHDAMFVHIEFDASHGQNDVDTLFLIVPFKANLNFDNIELCQCMQWCLNGKKLIESYRRNNDAREQAFQNGTDSATVNDATISNVPGAVLSEEELEKQRKFNAGVEPYLRVALLRQHSQLCRVRHRPAERPSELHQLGLDWHVAYHFARVAHFGRYCPICHRRHLHDSRCNGSEATAQLGGSRLHWWRRVLRSALLGASALLDWHLRRCSLGRCNGFCL